MTMSHPGTELLVDYASGAASEGLSLLVATHASLCPRCRDRIAAFEALGAAAMTTAAPDIPPSLERTLARLDDVGPSRLEREFRRPSRPTALPWCVQAAAGGDLREIDWLLIRAGVSMSPLDVGGPMEEVALYRLRPGAMVPPHLHSAEETMVVLGGSLVDGATWRRGDFAIAGVGEAHTPRAGEGEECLCLSLHHGAVTRADRAEGVADLIID